MKFACNICNGHLEIDKNNFEYYINNSPIIICPICNNKINIQSCTLLERERSKKDKLIVLLLCLFLGNLGIHRFYEGKLYTGLLMLLTFGGFCIWTTIDLIMIITDMVSADNKNSKEKNSTKFNNYEIAFILSCVLYTIFNVVVHNLYRFYDFYFPIGNLVTFLFATMILFGSILLHEKKEKIVMIGYTTATLSQLFLHPIFIILVDVFK